jgi:DNA-directed RNA polymerase II subunit RPB1
MSLSREIIYSEDVGRVQKVQFGLLSPERILKQSVCEITKSYRSNDDVMSNNKYNTLHDPRMGTNDRNILHPISKLSIKYDPGHFGHIVLPKPVIPSHFLPFVIKSLNLVCFRCSAIRINKNDKSTMVEIERRKGNARSKYVDEIASKITVCTMCGAVQPIKVSAIKNMVSGIGAKFPELKDKVVLNAENVLKIFKLINDEDCDLMGYDHNYSRPDWMVWTIFPVPPLSMRPSIKDETTGKSEDDDLTIKLNDIIKSCEELRRLMGNDKADIRDKENISARINEWWNCLTYHISTYIDNDERAGNTLSGGIPTSKSRSGRHLKTIRARMRSKAGHVRQNIMGKRVDHSARTVITGDPNLSINELGVPAEIAENLAYPETASKYNIGYLNMLLQKGKVKWIVKNKLGEKSSIKARTINVEFLKNINSQTNVVIEIGDTVWRNLQDNDIVFFNRQPTLHKMGMMAHKAVILEGKSFRLNGSCTSPYAADFDGDEMNMHVPISEACKYELEHITIVSSQIVSPQASKPVIGLIQDSLLAWYLITKSNNKIPVNVFMDIKGLWCNSYIAGTNKNINNVGTYDFITPTLPEFTLSTKPETSVSNNQEQYIAELRRLHRVFGISKTSTQYDNYSYEEIIQEVDSLHAKNSIKIENGNYIRGIFDKKTLGKSANGGLIHSSWKDCGHLRTKEFIDLMNKVATNWLLYEGFSVGLKDMRIFDQESIQNINSIIQEGFTKSEELIEKLYSGEIVTLTEGTPRAQFEADISKTLRSIRMKVEKITDKFIEIDNRMNSMITSGSKGSKANSVSVISMLGQQSVDGLRIQDTMDHRPLPFYSRDTVLPSSRGFIKNSYYSGLDPVEYLYHAMEGRLGVISTSIKTATTGYIQRKLVKVMEDLKVFYDGTVRNAHNIVIQPLYGNDGFDASKIERVRARHIKINNENFEKLYLLTDSDLQNMLEQDTYESMKSLPNYKEVLQNEYEQLQQDSMIASSAFSKGIESPVNYNRIISDIAYKFNLKNFEKATVSPVSIITKVKNLFDYLIIDDSMEIHNIVQRGFQIITRERLCSKSLLEYKFNPEALEYLLEKVKYMFVDAVINPGEMVGTVAAQSIGEPCTQLTLDSFHNTGLSSGANVSRGVPRIKELLENSKSIATPSVTIVLDKNIREAYAEEPINMLYESNKVATQMSETRLSSIIDNDYDIEVIYDPEDRNTNIQEDKAMIDEFYNMYSLISGNEYEQIKENFIIRMVLSNNELISKNFKTSEIKQAIESQDTQMQVNVSNDNADKIVLRVRTNVGNNRTTIKILKDIVIRGIDNIKRAIPNKDQPEVINTYGSNLLDVMAMHNIDQYKTVSNRIDEIYEIFGIEAARYMLLKEINDVLEAAETSINMRHLELLCDTMTYQGFAVSVSIHGVKKTDSGPLARASFEETTTELTRAAVFHEDDNMNGVSANIMFGQYLKAGTNDFGLVLDENMILNNDYEEEEEEASYVEFVNVVEEETYCNNEEFDLTFDF